MSSDSETSLLGVEDKETVGLISNIMEARSEHQMVNRFNLLCNVASVLGLIEIGLVLFWIIHFKGGLQWTEPSIQFNWHPLLMIIGLFYLHSQSILIYRRARFLSKKFLKISHATCHGLAFVLTVIGLVAAFDSHNYAIPPKPNMYSMHSWVGLSTVILYSSQFFFGFVTFLFPGLPKSFRSAILPVHTKFGSTIFMMTIVACMMGLGEKAMWMPKYSEMPSEAVLVNTIGMILVAFGGLVLYLVNDDTYKRVATADDEMALTNQ